MSDAVILGADDAGEILTLQRAAFAWEVCIRFPGYTAPITQTLQDLSVELSDDDCLAMGIRDGARLVAALRIRLTDDHTAYLARLSVAPDRAGEGLGAQLMGAVDGTVTQRFPGVNRIEISADGGATWLIAWYERLGFRVTAHGTENSPHEWRLARDR